MAQTMGEARAEISDLNARFALAVNTRDETLFRALWAADGSWRIDEPIGFDASGIDAIVSSWIAILQTYDYFAQTAHAGTISIAADALSARQQTTCNEWGRPSDGRSGYFNVGLYQDDLAYESGVWKYRRRVYRYLYIDTTPLAGLSYFTGNAATPAHDHAIQTLRTAATGSAS